MSFNKTQQYLIKKFENELSAEAFNDLEFLIENFFQHHNLRNEKNNSEKKTNWDELFIYKEALDQLSIQLSKIYFKLSYNFSTHQHVEKWNLKEQEWREYRKSINNMFFPTKESIVNEIETVSNEYKQLIEIENRLNKG